MRPSSHNPTAELHNLPEHAHEVADASRGSKQEHLTLNKQNGSAPERAARRTGRRRNPKKSKEASG